MFFHKPDTSFKRLIGCYKRAEIFAKKGVIDNKHPLAAAWSNAKLMLDAKSNYKTKPKNPKKLKKHLEKRLKDDTHDISILDWFSLKVDAFLKDNLIDGDVSLAAILYEWKSYLKFDPTALR